MAVTIQTLRDAELDATIKIVCDGDGDGGTTINISDLSGAEDDGTDRVSISRMMLTANGSVSIEWDADSGVLAAQLTSGQTDWTMTLPNNAGAGVTGDLIVTSGDAITHFTMILFLKKVAGFEGSALSYRKVMPPRRA